MGAKYDPARDRQHVEASRRIRDILSSLLRDLAPYSPTLIQSADGSAYTVLATRAPDLGVRRQPFEVYVVGYTSFDRTTARVRIAPGTILKGETDLSDLVTIAGLEDEYELSSGDALWITATFDEDGGVTDCSIDSGSRPSAMFVPYTGSNGWRHPLAQVRAAKDGEVALLADDQTIAQKCNTHLICIKACFGEELVSGWGFTASPGGWD